MQLLDVGLFSPLLTAYSKELNNFMFNSTGLVSITKQFFYTLFKPAFEKAFTKKNIINAFEKTRIYSLNPERVLRKIRKPKPKPKPVLKDKIL
jgi:hypothetical protein